MVRWLERKIRKHDFLYLSFLSIASSSLVTLALIFFYSWYITGKFPLLPGSQVLNIGEDSARFWIGSIYMPIFLAFVGITIAHRLVNNRSNVRLSPALDDDTLVWMAAESESRTLENLVNILGSPDIDRMENRGEPKASADGAGWEAHQQTSQPSGHYGMGYEPADDRGPEMGQTLKLASIYDMPPQDGGVVQMEQVAPSPAGHGANPQPHLLYDYKGMTDTYADNISAGPGKGSSPAGTENKQTEKKEPAKELDLIEQLKDPVNRKKLVVLLAGAET